MGPNFHASHLLFFCNALILQFCQIESFTKYFEGAAEEKEGHGVGGKLSSLVCSTSTRSVGPGFGLFFFFHIHLNGIFETESAVTG